MKIWADDFFFKLQDMMVQQLQVRGVTVGWVAGYLSLWQWVWDLLRHHCCISGTDVPLGGQNVGSHASDIWLGG